MTLEQYLHTSFENPDPEYVDGRLVERHHGELAHSIVVGGLLYALHGEEARLNGTCFISLRLRVKQTAVRVADVCFYLCDPTEQVPSVPPFLIAEVLSPGDPASEMQERIDDYLEFGTPFVWVIDPRRRSAVIHTIEGAREAKDRILRTSDPAIEIRLDSLFE